jgi:hypothetical protein
MGPATPFIQGEVLQEHDTVFGQASSGQPVAFAAASAKNHGLATGALESVRQENGDQIAMARPVGLLAVQDGVDLFVTQDEVEDKEVDTQSEDAGGASQSKDPEQASGDPSHMDEKEFDDSEEDGGDGRKKTSGKNPRKDLVEAVPESSETEEEDEEFENAGTVDHDHAEDEDHVDPPRKKKKSSDPGCLFTNVVAVSGRMTGVSSKLLSSRLLPKKKLATTGSAIPLCLVSSSSGLTNPLLLTLLLM